MKRQNRPRTPSAAPAAAPLQRDSATSLYRQIADQLEHDILAGHFAVHGKLPSEHELTVRFGVSRVTVRQAMDALLAAGLVVKKQGKGTFVAGQKLQHDLHSMQGFYDSLIAQGVEPETRLIEFAAVARPEHVDASLAGADDQCFFLRRIYQVGGEPIAMVCAYLPAEAARVSWQQASENPIYGILERLLQMRITRADVRIRAQPAGTRIGRELGLGPRAALLVMERESFGGDGKVAEHSSFYIRPENYEFLLSAQGPLPISSSIRGATRSRVEQLA
ncbi:GntR family transcriptional regulator [Pandoraea sp.]|uniref:GntR family transcriptional regulator n=1 Tax=Pandoraea sp. TaxID=1883445 RepID=UPI00120F85DD|nr:GntR family transcriptional regulator [Pandoraea sp.]TAL56232.1 MAG: GntR family transcriptional regulator [Pandoraea sp.]TAM19186.1 MAG: GntR family transcriptional regulator [Pandoraea sp.]